MKPRLKVIQLHKNELNLIKKALKKNREAQQMLFNTYSPKMLSVCRYYIKDIQHAESTMLEGFYKVFTKLNSYRDEGSFEGWIRRIMVRECIDFIRKESRVEFLSDQIEIKENQPITINSELEVNEIQELIDMLPEGYKMVFNMYAIEGYKHAEIAKILNISEGTSKSQLFKARKILQKKINNINKTSYGTN